ncbi:D-alanyl-D-alanine carboxypeptidase family protein [Lihuaxuella thermophila]|uniref:serine-type D-Ala-D-Ala carboxypeptidase n=1 Tax=Lihuaxuella thermophila TaxID=1173111 RepID=A0A1H8F4R4_9BACL|nr:D-alanyl-D-alanine carboxypeptidase family protein [Lihuaxuella thermophila]SEN26675.1 D-alanyl-D-alanine carboxypeptidase [Lihuaxuella thermophila]
MKKLLRIAMLLLMSALIITPAWNTGRAEPEHEPSVPDLAPGAKAAILMDAASGRVLYEKNADQKMLIASLTKIMTAIIAIENGKMDDVVTVGPKAVGVEGSSIYLKLGEKVPLGTLLYGLMLRSGNDAAMAIAEHIGGSMEGFVYMMNEKAAYLGLRNTHFANPHGLDAKDHYSTARDLATLTAYALKNPIFREIVKTDVKTVPWPGEQWHRKFYNKNKMLRFYKWADGVKTGFTKGARRTLVSSATKNGAQLITVTLNDGDDWKDSMAMFEYGFQHFDLVPVIQKGQVISKTTYENEDEEQLCIVAGTTFRYPLTEEEKEEITVEPVISYPLKLVRREQMQVGSARIYLDGELIGSIPLLTRYVKESSVLSSWKQVLVCVMGQGGAW